MRDRFSRAAGDPEGERQGAVAVAHRAALADGVVAFGRGQHVCHAAAGPERRGVVAGQVGVGTPGAVPVPVGVDQARVAVGPDGVGVEAGARSAFGRRLVRNTSADSSSRWRTASPGSSPDVECDGSLPPVGQREGEVHAATVRPDALRGQTAVGIATRSVRCGRRRRPSRRAVLPRPGRTPTGPARRPGLRRRPVLTRWSGSRASRWGAASGPPRGSPGRCGTGTTS